MEIDENNVFLLAKLIIEEHGDGGDLYNFQKIYIECYNKKHNKENSKDKAVKYLHDNFGLNDDIRYEYKDHLAYVNMDKFNL